MSGVDFDLELPSGRIRARRWGAASAPLLFCVPGLSANLAAFTLLGERLAGAHRQVVAIDPRGCGHSDDTGPGSYGLASHAGDVLAAADALGQPDFDFAGWSMGALIGLAVARAEPARLRSVALIEHAGPAQSRALAAVRSWLDRLELRCSSPEDYLHQIRDAAPVDVREPFWDAFYRYELGHTDAGGWRPLTSRAAALEDLDQAWPRDWSEYWRALRMPAVLVCARQPLNDAFIVPDRAVAALRDVNPRVRVVPAPDSNHFTCMTDPVTVGAVADQLA